MTEEGRGRISEANKGKKLSQEHRKAIADANRIRTRKPLSQAAKRKISEANIGRKVSLETRMKVALAHGGNEIYYSEDEDARDTRFRRRQSLEAKKRDNYTCQECGKKPTKGSEMHGHHIIPRSKWWRMEYYPLDWVETLCSHCHAASERQKGAIKWPRKSNSFEQISLEDHQTKEKKLDDHKK